MMRDNIMVTGYILICLATYEKLTGDDRYNKEGALNFEITKSAQFKHNTDSIYNAVMSNWGSCSYCLFPCEVRTPVFLRKSRYDLRVTDCV